MVADSEKNLQKVNKKYSLSTYLKTPDILKGERYSPVERRSIKCALEEIATTRKRRCISEGKKISILKELLKYPPDLAAEACHIYVSKGCAADGKNERYLFGIARQLKRQKEKAEEEVKRRAAINPATDWYDRGHVYGREYLEELAGRGNIDDEQRELLARARAARPNWKLKRASLEKAVDRNGRVPTRLFA